MSKGPDAEMPASRVVGDSTGQLVHAAWLHALGRPSDHALPEDSDFFRLGGDSLAIIRLYGSLQPWAPGIDLLDILDALDITDLRGFTERVVGWRRSGGEGSSEHRS